METGREIRRHQRTTFEADWYQGKAVGEGQVCCCLQIRLLETRLSPRRLVTVYSLKYEIHNADLITDDILADKLETSEDQLALDHMNKTRNVWNKSDVMMIR